MLDIKFIRENVDLVKTATKNKGFDDSVVDKLLEIDKERRKLIEATEEIRAKKNKLTKDDIEEGKKLKIELKELEENLKTAELEYEKLLWLVPNIPSSKSPVGKNDSENVEIRKWGTPRNFSAKGGSASGGDFTPKDHLELGKSLGILDFEAGSKVAGSQFYFLYGDGALLELALTHYVFDKLSKKGFLPVMTPDLAKSRYYLGTGYAPKGDEAQTYTIEGEDLGLIATAEVTLAGSHADEVIPEEKLPIKYIGYSHCFRQEAGAYGKYSKGLYRVHQFSKTEMFVYCTPETSERIHEELLVIEEEIYQELKLPYRVLEMCTGDLGAMAARKFDIEVWMPGRNDYGEVTSTSNCTDYQARNLNIKYKKKNGETNFVHMLNGTAVVMSRVPVAILENYQNEDGSVDIPKVLQKWMGKEKISIRS